MMNAPASPIDPAQSARESRVSKLLPIAISSKNHDHMRVVVRNISPYGLGIRGDVELLQCERLTIHLPGDRDVMATVRWVRKGTYGLSLDEPINPNDLQARTSPAGALTPKDADTSSLRRVQYPVTPHRPGFQRTHRDQVLLGSSSWTND